MNDQASRKHTETESAPYFLVVLSSSYQIVFATKDRDAARRAALSRPNGELMAFAMPEDEIVPLGDDYESIPQNYTLASLGETGGILRWKATLRCDFDRRSVEGATARERADSDPFAAPAASCDPDQVWWIHDALYAVERALAEMGRREDPSISLHTLRPDERTRVYRADGQWFLLPF